MISAYEAGTHLALGVRNDRTSDGFLKRMTANSYYRLMSMMGVDTIENHADFRLMSREALNVMLEYKEVNLFLRGIIPKLGFPVTLIPYKRLRREQGETKYTLGKMLGLAIDGATSFSITPLRCVTFMGMLTFVFATVIAFSFLFQRIVSPESTVPGWASTVLPLLLVAGVQILSVGILGEYIGKVYLEVKRRPRFIVEQDTFDSALASGAAQAKSKTG